MRDISVLNRVEIPPPVTTAVEVQVKRTPQTVLPRVTLMYPNLDYLKHVGKALMSRITRVITTRVRENTHTMVYWLKI